MIGTSNNQMTRIHVMAYPGYGYQQPDGRWKVLVSGVAWQAPVVFNRRQLMLIRMLGGVMQASPEDLQGELFQSRVTPFMADCELRPRISVQFGDTVMEFRRKTKRNGRFEQWFVLDDDQVQTLRECGSDGCIDFKIRVSDRGEGLDAESENVISLVPSTGISVVSDIDDTIKESAVGNRRELLNNTFLRKYTSVADMAGTYRKWGSQGARFHYVSASPWQLFQSLDQLRMEDGFPVGTMHLRNFRLRDQLFKKVAINRKGKRFAIERLIRNLPNRKYVLIGDSGEKDPEIYRKVVKRHQTAIKGVFIRDLDLHPMTPGRWKRITEDLPAEFFKTFKSGKDLNEMASSFFTG